MVYWCATLAWWTGGSGLKEGGRGCREAAVEMERVWRLWCEDVIVNGSGGVGSDDGMVPHDGGVMEVAESEAGRGGGGAARVDKWIGVDRVMRIPFGFDRNASPKTLSAARQGGLQ
ncbi:hypothetical protein Tco_0183704 [Tanacetum coccineum]